MDYQRTANGTPSHQDFKRLGELGQSQDASSQESAREIRISQAIKFLQEFEPNNQHKTVQQDLLNHPKILTNFLNQIDDIINFHQKSKITPTNSKLAYQLQTLASRGADEKIKQQASVNLLILLMFLKGDVLHGKLPTELLLNTSSVDTNKSAELKFYHEHTSAGLGQRATGQVLNVAI